MPYLEMCFSAAPPCRPRRGRRGLALATGFIIEPAAALRPPSRAPFFALLAEEIY